MKIFTINGVTYKSVPFDFNMICELEEKGISISAIREKPLTFVRSYFATCMGKSKEIAGKEIESHIVNGGTLDDVLEVMTYELENSDFFRSLSQTTETEVAETTEKDQN